METRNVIDMMGRTVTVPSRPMRIISLVPSQTELLCDLGTDERVCGITKFCIHPESWFRNKTRIGGTKNVNMERVKELQPDLIIANKEENNREQIEELERHYPVWVSDIRNLDDALSMIEQVGVLVNSADKAATIIDTITTNFSNIKKPVVPIRVAYFIWREPWMCAGGDTFISNIIERIGWVNVLKDELRYPSLTLQYIATLNPQLILLSSEPYPFKDKHIEEIKQVLPYADVQLVDGEMFSWYGSRLVEAAGYLGGLTNSYCDH